MATQSELLALLEKSAKRSEDTSDAYHEVLTSEGEKDIQLSDGTITPNLNKRIKELGGQVTSVAGKTGDVTINDLSEGLELGSAAKYNVSDLMQDEKLNTWSGRTQREKNKDVVSALDFGIIPNSIDDQTAKMDVFLDYLRTNSVKGILPVGTILVSCNKTKNFKNTSLGIDETFKYALDISGVTLEGVTRGYRGVSGTNIKCINPDGVALFQNQVDTSNTSYYLSNIRVTNAGVGLRMTYALHCRISNMFFVDGVDGIILGEASMSAGALCNQFENINIKCSGAALSLRGDQWNNANIFTNCFFTGDKPSNIHVRGGYGAIDNIFIGGEFNGASHGIILGNTRGTSFYNVYYEPHGHAVILDGQAKKVLLSNCTYGTTRKNVTESSVPCHIWHKTATASVIINGGCVFLGDTTGLQDNMRFIYSDEPASFICDVPTQPYVYTYGTVGWKLLDLQNISKYSSFSGVYQEDLSVVFSSSGAKIDGLLSTSKCSVTISGKVVTFTTAMYFDASTIFNAGEYYIESPITPKNGGNGVLRSVKVGTGGSTYKNSACHMTAGNKNLFGWMTQATTTVTASGEPLIYSAATSLTDVRLSNTSLSEFNTAGSAILMQVTFTI